MTATPLLESLAAMWVTEYAAFVGALRVDIIGPERADVRW